MKESPFGFQYSWQDLQPVRPLFVITLAAQLIGAAIGFHLDTYTEWFDNVWTGAALATFPGYLFGLGVQYRINAKRISENKIMVRRMGLVALLLSVTAIFVPKS